MTHRVNTLVGELKKSEDNYAALKARLEILDRTTPAFGKLPQLVKKLVHVPPDKPKLTDLEKSKDMFLTCLTYTMFLLSEDEDAWKRNITRANQGFLTHQEDQQNYIKETQKLNKRSRLLGKFEKEKEGEEKSGKTQPDTFIGPEGIKFLKNALGYDPPPEPAQYPPRYHGSVAVVDGASVLMV